MINLTKDLLKDAFLKDKIKIIKDCLYSKDEKNRYYYFKKIEKK